MDHTLVPVAAVVASVVYIVVEIGEVGDGVIVVPFNWKCDI